MRGGFQFATVPQPDSPRSAECVTQARYPAALLVTLVFMLARSQSHTALRDTSRLKATQVMRT
jgi:hypothetical protein